MSSPDPKLLESWKEIASHIRRDERTAMRWEALGMPVHRAPGERRGRVYAFAHEIDAWMAQHEAQLHANGGNGGHGGNGENFRKNGATAADAYRNGVPALANPVHSAILPKGDGLHPAYPASLESPQKTSATRRLRPRLLWAIALAAAVLLLAMGAYALLRPGPPVRYEVQGEQLLTFDAQDRLVWKKSFPTDLNGNPEMRSTHSGKFAQFVDMDGDRKSEFLFVGIPLNPALAGWVSCFDASGKQTWSYQPTPIKYYGGAALTPVFMPQFFLVSETAPGGPRFVWSYFHHQQEFASVIAKIDAQGNVLQEFWHAGHVASIAEATLEGRRVILLGGTNNEKMAGALAAIDFDNPQGSSPAETAQYTCGNCPQGSPLHYVLFPQSEIGSKVTARPSVTEIRQRPDGRIEVTVAEGNIPASEDAGSKYILDEQFNLLETEFAESYTQAHSAMRQAGMLDHNLDRKKEAAALLMLRWDGQRFVAVQWSSTP